MSKYKEKDFIYVCDIDDVDYFNPCTKSIDPYCHFYNYILSILGEDDRLKNVNVSSCCISEELDKKFTKMVRKWARKYHRIRGKKILDLNVGMLHLDVGPACFYRGQPEWADVNAVYIKKDFLDGA